MCHYITVTNIVNIPWHTATFSTFVFADFSFLALRGAALWQLPNQAKSAKLDQLKSQNLIDMILQVSFQLMWQVWDVLIFWKCIFPHSSCVSALLAAEHVCACVTILLILFLTSHRDVIPLRSAQPHWATSLSFWSKSGTRTVISVSYWWWVHSLTSDATHRHYNGKALHRMPLAINCDVLSKGDRWIYFRTYSQTTTGFQAYFEINLEKPCIHHTTLKMNPNNLTIVNSEVPPEGIYTNK